MKIITQKIWAIVGATALLAASFSLGYLAGSKGQIIPTETTSSLTPTDMDHAFGSVKPSVHESGMKEPAVMSLSGLVAGLEKKVAANPENIDQQLLLAQTYNQLDNRVKSLKLLNSLNEQESNNAQVKITLASILMTGMDKQELKQASKLFDEVVKIKPEAASMAREYQSEIRSKLDNMTKQ